LEVVKETTLTDGPESSTAVTKLEAVLEWKKVEDLNHSGG